MNPRRHRLPNRRGCEIFSFRHEDHTYTATIARFPDGRVAEIFLETGKIGSAVQAHAQDAAVLASIALQYGVPVETIRDAIAGPIRTALAKADEVAA
jgi:hypothetical protein